MKLSRLDKFESELFALRANLYTMILLSPDSVRAVQEKTGLDIKIISRIRNGERVPLKAETVIKALRKNYAKIQY